MSACCVCLQEGQLLRFACCQASCCLDCCLEWAQTQTNKVELMWTCPSCAAEVTIDKVTQRVSGEQTDTLVNVIADLALMHYINSQEDVQRCPSVGCSYAGFVQSDTSIACKELLQCGLCCQKWRNSRHPEGRSTIGMLFDRSLTDCLKIIYTKPCQKCGMRI